MKKMYDIMVAIILALACIISISIFSNTINKINKKENVIVVKSKTTLEKNIKEYSFYIELRASSKSLENSYELIYEKEDNIIKSTSFKYIKEKEIITTEFKANSDNISQYKILNIYKMSSNKLEDIEKMRLEVQKKALQIKDASITDIEIIFSNVDENQLINKAIKEAKDRAYRLAKENSKSLGDVVKIQQEKIIDNEKNASVTIIVTYEIN